MLHTKRTTLLLFFSSLLYVFIVSCDRAPQEPGYFPETGSYAIYQRALDLQNDINVLSIALEPGFEDLETLAYFRLGRGANISSAYLTNGEGGDNDIKGELPIDRAATRREEARDAIVYLGGEAYFLNFPDVRAYHDLAGLEKAWPSGAVKRKISELILKTKPDVVLIARDWRASGESLKTKLLRETVFGAVKLAAAGFIDSQQDSTNGHTAWEIDRILSDSGKPTGMAAPVDDVHPRWQKTYRTIAVEAANAYKSIASQREKWMADRTSSYSYVFSEQPEKGRAIDAGLPKPASAKLRRIEQSVRQLATDARDGKKKAVLKAIVTMMDSVALRMPKRFKLNARENRSLLAWKKGLDDLRNALLGVKVHYTVSDTALTGVQVTYLNISQIDGITEDGQTKIYFGGLKEAGWAINENIENNLPLVLNDPYRLLTPKELDYNRPHVLFGLDKQQIDARFFFFIIHKTKKREQSFIHRSEVKLSYVPRFEAEAMTPIVRMGQGERVLVRLKNHSRDGVTDTLRIDHEYATSTGIAFRLSNKEDARLITLFPVWNGKLNNGSYEIPISIQGEEVAYFTARKFDAVVDDKKKVGSITGIAESPLESALQRLRVNNTRIDFGQNITQQIDSLDVLFIDQRAMLLNPEILRNKEQVEAFVNNGGHLVILAQEADTWNANPLWSEVSLTATHTHQDELPVEIDSSHGLLKSPNVITSSDWQGWLFLRSYNFVDLSTDNGIEIPVKAKDSSVPLVITRSFGKGRKTYVDLALSPQLQNVHAGAFRLLANLVSY